MTKQNAYNRGFSWGKRTIIKEAKEEGEKALYKCDKATKTCRKYANDAHITKTKKGTPLTKENRQFYQGIADGMQDDYRRL